MDRLYLPPAPGEYLQGDIFADLPSVLVAERPLRAGRPFKVNGDRQTWGVHTEHGRPPNDGFKWRLDQRGESAVLVQGYIEMGMLISHDCEIENDDKWRTVAMIRPLSHLDETTQARLFSGREEDVPFPVFPLDAEVGSVITERCFVDFRRLTTVRPAVLDESTRIASVAEEVRFALAMRFREYLFRRVEPPKADSA